MRKQNKLYTANKWNQPLFAQGVDRERHNIFDIAGPLETPTNSYDLFGGNSVDQWALLDKKGLMVPSQPSGSTGGIDLLSSIQKVNNPGTISAKPGTTPSASSGSGAASGMIAGAVDNMVWQPIRTKLTNTKYGSMKTKAGNIMDAAGTMAMQSGNPYAMAGGAALKLGSLIVDRGFGHAINQRGVANIKNNNLQRYSTGSALVSNAATPDDVLANWGNINQRMHYDNGYVGVDGWWSHKAKRLANTLRTTDFKTDKYVNDALALGSDKANKNLVDRAKSQFIYADGGFLDNIDFNNMGAVDFNFMSDYLLQKDRQNSLKNKMSGIPSTPTINSFAMGGPKGKKERVYSSGSWKLPNGWKEEGIRTPHGTYYRRTTNESGPDTIYTYQPTNMYSPKYMFEDSWWTERRVPSGRKTAGYDIIKDEFENYSKDAVDDPNSFIQVKDNIVDAANSVYDWVKEALTPATRAVKKKANGGSLFAIGGDLQTNGADWSTGLTRIDAGGSHSENPNEGVQMGVDREGTPNLVEQGETVFNDYVYSTRILIDDETKRKFHIGKKREMSYADLSKKLEKESSERPNDPISQAALKAQMAQLAEEQERQKAEMQEAQAQEAFASLSPEEKQALLMEAEARRQQGTEEQQMAEQTMAEQAGMQEPSPEEVAMAQQQMMADGSEPSLGTEPEGYAYGGKVNRFDDGGTLKQKIYNALKLLTDKDFDKWAKDNNIGDVDWNNILKNQAFIDALSKDNAALKHVLGSGYDFGVFTPGADGKINFDDDRGNWDAQTVAGWWGSEDPAWKEVIKAHPELTKDTVLTREQLADYLRNTNAFKKGTKWLEDSEDNRLTYLQRIINNPNAPKKAVEYARKFIDENGWKKDAARDYNTIFNNPSGRAANPGTYWKTPIEAVRDKIAKNFVINDDGTVEEMAVDVPDGWKTANEYSWSTPEHDMTYRYFKRPVDGTSPADGTKDKGAEDEWEVTPNYKNENLRYAGLFGPLAGLGMMAAGIGKPNTGLLDASLEILNNGPALATYKPIGDYIKYRPMDIWYNQNRMDANARATDRALINNSAPVSTRAAGLLANSYNSQIGSGELYRQALEYNDNLRKQVADFNRGTNQFNAESFNRTSLQNAEMLNRQNQLRAQMAAQVANEKMAADAGWYNSMYGNVGNLFKGISDLGRENAQHNMIAEMAADDIFGPMSPRTNTGRRGKYLTFTKRENAKGGKLNNKKK